MGKALLDWASFYVSKGFSVVPLRPKTRRPYWGLLKAVGWVKEDGRPTWEPARERLPTEDELETWFAGKNPREVGIGLVIPKDIAVVDLKRPELWDLFFNGSLEDVARSTWVVRTGKGLHVYLRIPRPIDRPLKVEGWVEIRTEGLLTTAPPSIHPNGRQYELLSPEGVEIDSVDDSALQRLLRKVELAQRHRKLVETVAPTWTSGRRHNLAGALAGFLRKRGIPQSEAEFIVRAICLLAGDREVKDRLRFVEDAYRKPLGEIQGLTGLQKILGEEAASAIESAVHERFTRLHLGDVSLEVKALEHLTDLEEPQLSGRDVVVDAVVASTAIPYTVPARYYVRGGKDGDEWETECHISERKETILQLVGVPTQRMLGVLRQDAGAPAKAQIEVLERRTVYHLWVRPVVTLLEQKDDKIVDESGREYKHFDVYIVTSERLPLEPGTVVRLYGRVLPDPRTQRVTLLVYRVEFPDHAEAYDPENVRRLLRKFEGWSVPERVDWILSEVERGSGIVGRKDVALTYLLSAFTPLWMRLENQLVRGWANSAIIGDSTTGKSHLGLWVLRRVLKAGTLVTAELASIAGLTGAVKQMPTREWVVDWGLLPLNHRKYLILDGAQKLTKTEYRNLAETERQGVVVITKAAKADAPAQVRTTKIFNPIEDREFSKETKNLADFYRPVQALTTVLDRVSIARLDWVVFVDARDVPPELINSPRDGKYDPDLELLADVRGWCWSGEPKVVFDPDAWLEILNQATRLQHKYYVETIPLLSNDAKYKLARMAAALAFLTLSTDESLREVRVTKEHVDFIVRWLEEIYDRAGLGAYAQEARHEGVTEERLEEILAEIAQAAKVSEEVAPEILRFIVHQGRVTRDQIRQKFSLTERKLRSLLTTLRNLELIRQGNGFYPTPALIKAVKILDGVGASRSKGGATTTTTQTLPNMNMRIVPPDLDKLDKLGAAEKSEFSPLSSLSSSTTPTRTIQTVDQHATDTSQPHTGLDSDTPAGEVGEGTLSPMPRCPICGRIFATQADLRFHLRTHGRSIPASEPETERGRKDAGPPTDTGQGPLPDSERGRGSGSPGPTSGGLGTTSSSEDGWEVVDVCHICLRELQEDERVEVHNTGQRPGWRCEMCGQRNAVMRVRYRVVEGGG